MGDTIENKDIEIVREDKKTEFLENKIGLPDPKVIKEVGLNEISSKKGDTIMNRLNTSLINHKYIKNKKKQ